MKRKTALVVGVIMIALVLGVLIASNKSSTEEATAENFDPAIYFEGEQPTQQEIDTAFTEEELKEIDQIYNES